MRSRQINMLIVLSRQIFYYDLFVSPVEGCATATLKVYMPNICIEFSVTNIWIDKFYEQRNVVGGIFCCG